MTLLMDSLFLRFFVFISAETLCHYGKYGSAFFRMQKHKFCRTRMTPPPPPQRSVLKQPKNSACCITSLMLLDALQRLPAGVGVKQDRLLLFLDRLPARAQTFGFSSAILHMQPSCTNRDWGLSEIDVGEIRRSRD